MVTFRGRQEAVNERRHKGAQGYTTVLFLNLDNAHFDKSELYT